MTLDEHKELGRQLYDVRHAMTSKVAQLARTQGPKSKAYVRIQEAIRAVDRLRDELDNVLAREHPEDFSARVYYPGVSDA